MKVFSFSSVRTRYTLARSSLRWALSAFAIAMAIGVFGCKDDSSAVPTGPEEGTDCPGIPPYDKPPEVPYEATQESLATHPLPEWFDNAKFGIMIHWGLYSVPGWAETTLNPEEWLSNIIKFLLLGQIWYKQNPYAEWYGNTMRIEGSGAWNYHRNQFGPNFLYEDFREVFEVESAGWSAEEWADLFAEAGAKYVVLGTKHHDGFTLWPSRVEHPHKPGWHTARDYVGELSAAVRARHMCMGLYYSGGIDWSFKPGPIKNTLDFLTSLPKGQGYADFVDAQWRELIERYRPACLWNDIDYPQAAEPLQLFADYYNKIPDGVVNDRWSPAQGLFRPMHRDYSTPEYDRSPDINPDKFETVRGMGRSFGYNRNEDKSVYLSSEEIIHQLVDIVSKNGNLLLNVGPMADGTIPVEQVERLQDIGRWIGVNGEAIFETRPWSRAEGVTSDGTDVRYTWKSETIYATVLGPVSDGTVTIEDFGESALGVTLLGVSEPLEWSSSGGDLVITLPGNIPEQPAHSFAIRLE